MLRAAKVTKACVHKTLCSEVNYIAGSNTLFSPGVRLAFTALIRENPGTHTNLDVRTTIKTRVMSESDKRKPLRLMGGLAVVALGINLIFARTFSPHTEPSFYSRPEQVEVAKSAVVLR